MVVRTRQPPTPYLPLTGAAILVSRGAQAPQVSRQVSLVVRLQSMPRLHNAKVKELQRAMRALGENLDRGDPTSLLVEVMPGQLVCSYRRVRRRPIPKLSRVVPDHFLPVAALMASSRLGYSVAPLRPSKPAWRSVA